MPDKVLLALETLLDQIQNGGDIASKDSPQVQHLSTSPTPPTKINVAIGSDVEESVPKKAVRGATNNYVKVFKDENEEIQDAKNEENKILVISRQPQRVTRY